MRLFVSVRVPENQKISGVLQKLLKFSELRTVDEKQLHVCLQFLGEVDEDKTAEIKQRLGEVSGFGGFKVALKSIGAFPSKARINTIWIGIESERLEALASTVQGLLEPAGFVADKEFLGHVTLARAKRRPPAEVFELLSESADFGSFEVIEVELVSSVLTPEGPKHEIIYSVKL